ncbi:MAG: hypothetical protein CMA39_05220 [Euryarchaeota archaeon]|jgi:hypothetical protein|nr:hypothetical protein [Euryarchaeota archaeon]MCH2647810.1 hypothetical protein [Candidatus Poseidoniaceae archaeon]DAC38742.1 MAG TPA: hypothetical protein D7H83_05985 [Candidatus Poseidoniales archaeon]HIH57926.1 hypothetical protein [Candidatus Poseidoniaceae archaeon]|tara:strand:- start:238 stop:708 length:471 start_codon:yes stop_codon:yes gene_type:complete
MKGRLVRDQSGASTELGYIFTFLLGVLFLSMFSVWAFGLETSTRENWNTTAVDVNMADIAAAVERADLASREDSSVRYAEVVSWRLTEADESEFVLTLDDEGLHLDHPENELDRDVSISATGSGTYDGRITLSGTTEIWIVYDEGKTYLANSRPDF